MATLAGLTTKTLDHVYGTGLVERPAEDTIDATFNAAVTTMPVTTDSMWKRDDYAEFNSNELVIAISDGTGTNVEVRRGKRGTTDANQTSGATITRNPPYPRIRVEDRINEVIRHDLYPHVWTWFKGSFTFATNDHMYDLATNIEEVMELYQYNLNSDNRFHPISNGWWDVKKQVDTGAASNSNLLRVKQVHDETATVYYTAKRRPATLDLSNVSSEIEDMIPWAAAAKLMAGREGQATLDAARSRYDDSGTWLRSYRGLMAEFFRMRTALNLVLRDEVEAEPRFKPRFQRRF